jgi:putative glycosyltransferase (TIGR04372 family)
MSFVKKILYFQTLSFLKFLLIISVNIFFFRKKNLLKKNLCVPDQNTYGDSILFYDYVRLLNLKKKSYFIIIPKVNQQINLVKIFFKKKQYIVYDEIIYNIIILFFKLFYSILNKENGSLFIDFNYLLNQLIQKKISKNLGEKSLITLYKKYNIRNDNFLKKYKKYFSDEFIKKYLQIRYLDNKNEFSLDHIKLIKKQGSLDLKKNLDVNFLKEKIFHNLNITQKYICLFLRPYVSNKKFDYETDVRSSRDIKGYLRLCYSYLKKKGYQIILIGSYNKFFDNKVFSNFINYRNSKFQNPINDFILTNYCEFAICNSGGYAILPSILNKPNLMVNSSCFFDNYFFDKTIYYPKHYLKNKIELNILDIVKNPIFFEATSEHFRKQNILTKDISYLELFNAVKEFIRMIKKNKFDYPHPMRDIIKKKLTPLHLLFNFSYKRLSISYLNNHDVKKVKSKKLLNII